MCCFDAVTAGSLWYFCVWHMILPVCTKDFAQTQGMEWFQSFDMTVVQRPAFSTEYQHCQQCSFLYVDPSAQLYSTCVPQTFLQSTKGGKLLLMLGAGYRIGAKLKLGDCPPPLSLLDFRPYSRPKEAAVLLIWDSMSSSTSALSLDTEP